jgi:hypothetical protein
MNVIASLTWKSTCEHSTVPPDRAPSRVELVSGSERFFNTGVEVTIRYHVHTCPRCGCPYTLIPEVLSGFTDSTGR